MNSLDAALAVDEAWMALGNEWYEAEGAAYIRNLNAPLIRDANHVRNVKASTPEEVEALLARMEQEFAGVPHRCYRLDHRTPTLLEARLALEGYQRGDSLMFVLEGELPGSAKQHEIRLVEGEGDWEAYSRLREMDWQHYIQRQNRPYDETEVRAVEQMVACCRAKVPPVRYWLAYVDGEPRAYLGSWEGPNGVGQVEDLFTHPDFRHRGLATALIQHGVADARARGAGPIAIAADPSDTPKQMYAAMGFRPLAVTRSYWRKVEAGSGRAG